ncbi:uncharacterized protein LOC134727106 [Mytilus trossulus]|uniref:uncharacterized protein LOC134727106 n=1 Tax=Mytilus trossulus TaxID=6551 RepID=UPI003007357D
MMARGILILAVVTLFVLSVESDELNFLEEVVCTAPSFTLRPEKWPMWYVVMGSDVKGQLHGSHRRTHLGDHNKFHFERINANEPYFYITSKRWKEYYVYMTDTPQGLIQSTNTKPGEDGEWKIQKVSEGEYALSPRKWPNWHMCMKNDATGTMYGCKGAVGPEGRFFIDKN